MSETPAQPPAPVLVPPAVPAEPAHPGFFERTVEHVFPHADHAAAEAAILAGDVKTAIKDHAGQVFDVAGEVLAIVKLLDPADAAAITAAEALAVKVFAMVGSAAKIAGAVHSA